jgi:hypothetical protein
MVLWAPRSHLLSLRLTECESGDFVQTPTPGPEL